MQPTRYCVRITYPRGLGPVAYLSHRNRSAWTRRTARKHAIDIRAGRTGIRGFAAVDVVEA